MDNQEQLHQYATPQEIDLVDLAAVLYRRKVILFLVIVICFVGAVFYWSLGKQKATISMSFETGRNGQDLIMESNESSNLLSSFYLPRYLEAEVEILNFGGGIVGFDKNVVRGQPQEDFLDAVSHAFKDLLVLHNKIFDRFLENKNKQLAIKIREFEVSKKVAASPERTVVDLSILMTLEAAIMNLENQIDISYPSTISDTITITPIPTRGWVLYVVAGTALGIFCGCGLVFFLELMSKAKARVRETI